MEVNKLPFSLSISMLLCVAFVSSVILWIFLLYIEKKLELIGIKYIAQCTKTKHQTLFPMSTDQEFAFLQLGSIVPVSWGWQGWTMIYKCWYFLSDGAELELTHSLNIITVIQMTGVHRIQMQSCKPAGRAFLFPTALKVHHWQIQVKHYVCPSYSATTSLSPDGVCLC